ncbi:BgTH12-02130 [Blumeria graminis f. sp. triticale]|uniref:BgtAc-31349 n=3 Tax=Blumeria graminis TaxID=34373 RepID=A0A9X9MFT0_BLUGR|nr:BgTH12-02130 [Blumeria graminis f. sp. triticale]VDB85794.1 BgtAc-31349 [Blumeria graminis f. sp. tritici]
MGNRDEELLSCLAFKSRLEQRNKELLEQIEHTEKQCTELLADYNEARLQIEKKNEEIMRIKSEASLQASYITQMEDAHSQNEIELKQCKTNSIILSRQLSRNHDEREFQVHSLNLQLADNETLLREIGDHNKILQDEVDLLTAEKTKLQTEAMKLREQTTSLEIQVVNLKMTIQDLNKSQAVRKRNRETQGTSMSFVKEKEAWKSRSKKRHGQRITRSCLNRLHHKKTRNSVSYRILIYDKKDKLNVGLVSLPGFFKTKQQSSISFEQNNNNHYSSYLGLVDIDLVNFVAIYIILSGTRFPELVREMTVYKASYTVTELLTILSTRELPTNSGSDKRTTISSLSCITVNLTSSICAKKFQASYKPFTLNSNHQFWLRSDLVPFNMDRLIFDDNNEDQDKLFQPKMPLYNDDFSQHDHSVINPRLCHLLRDIAEVGFYVIFNILRLFSPK